MKKLIAVLLLAFPALCFAGKHAPLPTGVMTAKTVYIVNQTGMQNVADGAYQQFTKWGRYSVAPSKSSADLMVIFTRHERLVDGTSHPAVGMDVYLAGDTQDAVYEDIPGPHFGYAAVARACVKDFRKRVEGK